MTDTNTYKSLLLLGLASSGFLLVLPKVTFKKKKNNTKNKKKIFYLFLFLGGSQGHVYVEVKEQQQVPARTVGGRGKK